MEVADLLVWPDMLEYQIQYRTLKIYDWMEVISRKCQYNLDFSIHYSVPNDFKENLVFGIEDQEKWYLISFFPYNRLFFPTNFVRVDRELSEP